MSVRRSRHTIVFFLLISITLNVCVHAQTSPPVINRPRLVVLIVVDQFRYDYLERFGDLLGTEGIGRIVKGAVWTNANYDHSPTYTAPGHAAIMTGTWPAENGIIANDWYDRAIGKSVSSVSDESFKSLGGGPNESASSPRRLMASTLGDELRIATNDRSKVIGISVKDRSAILPAGRHANAAYWFSSITGMMESSSYYFKDLPEWVKRYDSTRPADKYFGAHWERLLPESEYLRRAGEDAPSWENIGNVKDSNTFPHTITGGATGPSKEFYESLAYSPFSNDLLVDFTEKAIVEEQLGKRGETDLLTVSFSANDYVGHRFGPYSQEIMDMTLRTDRQIGTLLKFIDEKVGLKNTIVVFTADHGMAPFPEQATTQGLPGGRVSSKSLTSAMRSAIASHFQTSTRTGESQTGSTPATDYISAFVNGNVYFNIAAITRDGIKLDEIERVAGDAAMSIPGVTRYFTRAQLSTGAISDIDPIQRRVLHGFNPQRSGDLVILLEPYKYLSDSTNGATHGSPYSYDTHVPLILYGPGIRPGRYSEASSPADIPLTLATILRIQPPSNQTGRVLSEALLAQH